MMAQTSIQQNAQQLGGREEPPASHSTGQAQSHAQQPATSAGGENVATGNQDTHSDTSTARVAGVGILISVTALILTVFVAGFMRTRVERGLRHLYRRFLDVAQDIDVPLLLPLTIVETIREVLADRRVMAPPSGEQPAMD